MQWKKHNVEDLGITVKSNDVTAACSASSNGGTWQKENSKIRRNKKKSLQGQRREKAGEKMNILLVLACQSITMLPSCIMVSNMMPKKLSFFSRTPFQG